MMSSGTSNIPKCKKNKSRIFFFASFDTFLRTSYRPEIKEEYGEFCHVISYHITKLCHTQSPMFYPWRNNIKKKPHSLLLILFGAFLDTRNPTYYIYWETLFKNNQPQSKIRHSYKKRKYCINLLNAKLRVHFLLRKPQHSKRRTLSYPVVCRVETILIKGWQQIEKLLLRPDL